MEGLSVRLLPFVRADGPWNMAADEVLVETAAQQGQASLRFYAWSPPTLSLGYFQLASARLANSQLAQLPWVRRSSGGATLVHHHELTYCLALPASEVWHAGEPWMIRMHRIIAAALADIGFGTGIALVEEPCLMGDVLCFERQTAGDLVCASAKIVGSAQRKHRRALLQHGGILLARSPFTPSLAGLRELTGVSKTPEEVGEAVAETFAHNTGWRLAREEWTDREERQIESLAVSKYRTIAWNEKR